MDNGNNKQRPLILFTNDDGIESPGLWANVAAFAGLGELLVVAPAKQQSGMGRSMPTYSKGTLEAYPVPEGIPKNTRFLKGFRIVKPMPPMAHPRRRFSMACWNW